MGLYAIADLHLSFTTEKPMDIYGGWWINHTETIMRNWQSLISENDTVIIPGDISWALKLEDAKPDLDWLSALPGRKILIKGNHDLWWSSISKLTPLYSNLFFVQNNFFAYDDYAICGTRGWICPGENDFGIHDEKIYLREVNRLSMSFESAVKYGYKKFIGACHFPPTNEKHEPSGFTEIFEKYCTEKVVYGHLHGDDAYENGFQGTMNGVEYILTACDHVQCNPVKIL